MLAEALSRGPVGQNDPVGLCPWCDDIVRARLEGEEQHLEHIEPVCQAWRDLMDEQAEEDLGIYHTSGGMVEE